MKRPTPPTAAAFVGLALLLAPASIPAAELADPKKMFDGVAAASDEAERALKSFAVPEGMKVELIAAEPLLANPVAFAIDESGRFYVVETFRHGAGILDIRSRRGWPRPHYREGLPRERAQGLADEVLDTDLATRSVDDRVAYLKSFFGNDAAALAGKSDRIRLLWDTNNDGKPDQSSVFADGFSRPEDGLAAGVITRRGQVWFANIPNLWLLADRDRDGVAEQRQILRHGFGIRSGFLGHDMHGFTFGPDGKLYFTIGDRSAHVPIDGGATLDIPDSGAVFRCDPDGSGMEIFATGLRNPQELTFDHRGDLFTGDNNSDGGDQARWVHLVEGGDSGWRIGYQFLEGSTSIYHRQARGPWNAEKMWHESNPDQPAFLIPPVGIIGNGPSGVAYYPGTGLSPAWNGQFFMVDFRGQPSNSGIQTFNLLPHGAGFKLGTVKHFIWNVLATDLEFGPDPGVYVLDWVSGWGVTGKGRIYRVYAPSMDQDVAAQTKSLIREGMTQRSNRELARWLEHADYRVRLDAQFELVRRGEAGLAVLAAAAEKNRSIESRLHGVWGLGQILNWFRPEATNIRAKDQALKTLIGKLADPAPDVRAQSAKTLGDARAAEALPQLVRLASDTRAAVQFQAVMALGKLRDPRALPAILAMLRQHNDADPLLRHAGVMALTAINEHAALESAARDPAGGVRMAALLAMRRLKSDAIAQFLDDPDSRLVREAARAINDTPINGATLALARHEPANYEDPVIVSRVINANLRAATLAHAQRLAQIGADSAKPEPTRQDALLALAEWPNPSGRDRVTGVWRPWIASSRDNQLPTAALEPHLPALLADGPEKIQLAAITAAAQLRIVSAAAPLLNLVRNSAVPQNARIESLNALEAMEAPELLAALDAAAASGNERLAGAAAAIRVRKGLGDALGSIQSILASGGVEAKQSAIRSLAELKSEPADRLLLTLLGDLRAEKLANELAVDVLDAAASREREPFTNQVDQIETGDGSPLAPYRFALHGGNAEAGKKIFFEREDVACLRCHQTGATGGDVGPNLEGIASRVTPQYLLESIVTPNAAVAPGFENVMLEKSNGSWVAGMIKSEDERQIVLNSPEDGLLTLDKSEIKSRRKGASSMPEGLAQILGRQNLRDLIAYLMTLK